MKLKKYFQPTIKRGDSVRDRPALRLAILAVLALSASWILEASDQTGAEKRKRVVSAAVATAAGTKAGGGEPGNIEVTYEDGTKDRWTLKGNAGMPRVAPDGTVGWVVFAPERKAVAASYRIRPCHKMVRGVGLQADGPRG